MASASAQSGGRGATEQVCSSYHGDFVQMHESCRRFSAVNTAGAPLRFGDFELGFLGIEPHNRFYRYETRLRD